MLTLVLGPRRSGKSRVGEALRHAGALEDGADGAAAELLEAEVADLAGPGRLPAAHCTG
jgi:hypothetical protein